MLHISRLELSRMLLADLIRPEITQFNLLRHAEYADPSFVPIHLTGGIGDVIIGIEAIKFLSKRFRIAVYTRHIETFKYFYKDQIPVAKDLPNFSWHLEIHTFGKFHCSDRFHGFLIKEHEDLWTQQQRVFLEHPRLESIVKTHFNKFFLIAGFAKELGLTRHTFPLFSLGYENTPSFEFLPRVAPEKYITVHDGFDIQSRGIVNGRSTKTWDIKHWKTLVQNLKKSYNGYKIIQLGATTAREIEGVDECLINKTSITECFDILSKSSLHIDGDSGLTHAATKMQVPVIALWGPTPVEFYGYKQNTNIKSSVCEGSCYGAKENWSDNCPIGYGSPKCMDEILPDQIKTPPF